MNNKHLVAVYGSLLSGLGNNPVIQNENTELLGEIISEPVYTLYDLGYFPGLHENGSTAVKMEVYSVDDEIALDVDGLEGYSPDRPATFYDKKSIETPWGTASVYIYMGNPEEDQIIESGDWKSHYLEKRQVYEY